MRSLGYYYNKHDVRKCVRHIIFTVNLTFYVLGLQCVTNMNWSLNNSVSK